MQPNSANANLAANSDNAAQMLQTFTPTFGNLNFTIQPSMSGEVSNTFGTIPYLSLESLIYAQANGAQITPNNILGGQSTGQQNIQGSFTIQDANGQTRMIMGYNQGGF